MNGKNTIGLAIIGALTVISAAHAITCNPITQSLVDGRCIDQRRPPGYGGGWGVMPRGYMNSLEGQCSSGNTAACAALRAQERQNRRAGLDASLRQLAEIEARHAASVAAQEKRERIIREAAERLRAESEARNAAAREAIRLANEREERERPAREAAIAAANAEWLRNNPAQTNSGISFVNCDWMPQGMCSQSSRLGLGCGWSDKAKRCTQQGIR